MPQEDGSMSVIPARLGCLVREKYPGCGMLRAAATRENDGVGDWPWPNCYHIKQLSIRFTREQTVQQSNVAIG
jgi:hypothetical protein